MKPIILPTAAAQTSRQSPLLDTAAFLRKALAITTKDVRVEMRTRELFSSMFVFALIVSVWFPKHHKTKISLRNGTTLCGKVLRVDASRIVFQLSKSGKIRVIRTADTLSIRDNSC